MLVVFHLGWDRFNIDQKVSAATRKVNGIAHDKGANRFMIFNLASLGAGERIIDREERVKAARAKDPDFDAKASWVDKALDHPEEAPQPKPSQRTVDYIRRRHHRIARDLGNDEQFKAYRDAAEMLSALRTRGHQLAAVFTGASKEAQQGLKLARALDYFEDNVYGYDSLEERETSPSEDYRHVMRLLTANPPAVTKTEGKLSAGSLFRHALKKQKTAAVDSIIVADTPMAIYEGALLKPMAVAGYLDPYLANEVIDHKLLAMRRAGAHYAVVGGHGVSSLPDYLHGTRRLQSQRDLAMKKLGFDLQ